MHRSDKSGRRTIIARFFFFIAVGNVTRIVKQNIHTTIEKTKKIKDFCFDFRSTKVVKKKSQHR